MKKILLFIIILFAASSCLYAQVTTNGPTGHYDVLTCYNNGGFNSGSVKITTKIPMDQTTNTSVYIKGYDSYGAVATINLQVSWQNGGGYFDSYSASNSGIILPQLYLGADAKGFTVIYLSGYYLNGTRFEISAYANGYGESPSWFTDWDVTDEDTYDAWVQVELNNSFDNVSANTVGAGYVSASSVYGVTVNSQTLYANSKLGVGTYSPLGKMQVKGTQGEYDGPTRMYLTNNASIYGRTNFIMTGRIDGSNDAWQFGSSARNSIVFATNEAGATGSVGTEKYSMQLEGNSKSLGFISSASGNNPTMVLAQNGYVGIGTINPQAKLSVNGNILAKKVKVSIASADWPDYVFGKEYKLRPLSELASFIKKNRHLPGVPSATQVGSSGIDIGDNQAILLQKVEELTLYIIEQDKKTRQQEEKLKLLEDKLNKLLSDKK